MWLNLTFITLLRYFARLRGFEIVTRRFIFTALKPILEIKHISKKFNIQGNSQPYLSLRESLLSFSKLRSKKEDFWALSDVSFTVEQGDTVGIVGKNGAGKSTLLKVLSKITPPTSGSITCRGRIASLLEVGTGFHPELSGKENIFMNGSILGMRRSEIQKNFDAIVEFSGVEKFINTPLKHYSSGMQLRLAFAVAAFLENEILVIDEVLAVGDAEFQKKCMGKMEDVSRSGRTILFVSHNIQAIQALCKKGVLLEKGQTDGIKPISEVVKNYLKSYTNDKGHEVFQNDSAKAAWILEAKLYAKSGVAATFYTHDELKIEMLWENVSGIAIHTNVELHNVLGQELFWSIDAENDWTGKGKSEKGFYRSTLTIPANFLKEGQYFLRLALLCPKPESIVDLKYNIMNFSIVDARDERSMGRGPYSGDLQNFTIVPSLPWTLQRE